jgi:putative ABC transport system ATP-binding protein
LRINGRDLRGLDATALADMRRGIGFIFQLHNLFDCLTALENVQMATDLSYVTVSEARQRAEELLTLLGLGHRFHYKPEALSGGQRQRVAIARALINRPKLVLADEPTAALDKDTGRVVVELLRDRARKEDCAIILVTHDNRILDIADRIVHMVDGQLVSDTATDASATICEALTKVRTFAGLTPAQLTEVAHAMSTQTVPEHTNIVRQDEKGQFHLILKGTVHMLVDEGQGATLVASLSEGDTFGESSLFHRKPSRFTFRAAGGVELATLSRVGFKMATGAAVGLREELLRTFAHRSPTIHGHRIGGAT